MTPTPRPPLLEHPEFYQYDINVGAVSEVWRRGSVIASWLLDLTAIALLESPDLEEFGGRVSDSGEGRWTTIAAIDSGVPAPVLTSALYSRFDSQGNALFANKVQSAMRKTIRRSRREDGLARTRGSPRGAGVGLGYVRWSRGSGRSARDRRPAVDRGPASCRGRHASHSPSWPMARRRPCHQSIYRSPPSHEGRGGAVRPSAAPM